MNTRATLYPPSLISFQDWLAANWWADAVTHTKYDNGDDGPAGGMAMMLATLSRQSVDGGQREKFVQAITAEMECFEDHDTLDVDYAPCNELRNAMTRAGISTHNAPWKTIMWFCNGGVQVKHGYGAEERELLLKTAA